MGWRPWHGAGWEHWLEGCKGCCKEQGRAAGKGTVGSWAELGVMGLWGRALGGGKGGVLAGGPGDRMLMGEQ